MCTANNEINAETGTAQTLFNGQKKGKWESSLQINFSTQSTDNTNCVLQKAAAESLLFPTNVTFPTKPFSQKY